MKQPLCLNSRKQMHVPNGLQLSQQQNPSHLERGPVPEKAWARLQHSKQKMRQVLAAHMLVPTMRQPCQRSKRGARSRVTRGQTTALMRQMLMLLSCH